MGQQWPGGRGSGCSRPRSHSMWHKPFRKRLPLASLQGHWADDPETAEQLYQRNSCTVKKVLGPTVQVPTWEPSKVTKNPQWIWFWKPVRFDYRTSTGLGKQTLGGHKQNLVHTRSREKGAVSPQETESDLTKPCAYQKQGERSSVPTRNRVRLLCECLGISGGGLGRQFGLRPNNREGLQPQPPTENWIKDLLNMALPIRIRPSSPQLVFPIRKLP